jgi:hypothetical protein
MHHGQVNNNITNQKSSVNHNLPYKNNPKIKPQIKPSSYDRKKMIKVEKGEGIWENIIIDFK